MLPEDIVGGLWESMAAWTNSDWHMLHMELGNWGLSVLRPIAVVETGINCRRNRRLLTISGHRPRRIRCRKPDVGQFTQATRCSRDFKKQTINVEVSDASRSAVKRPSRP